MMKASKLLFLLLLPSLVLSQSKETSKISVGINVSPNYSYRMLRYSKNLENAVLAREENERVGFGYNAGLMIRYAIFPKFEIEFGAQFANQTTQFKNINYTNSDATVLGTADVCYNYNYLELPFRVNYKFFKKQNLTIYSTIGASPNFLLASNSKAKITAEDGSKSKEKISTDFLNVNKYTTSFLFGIGVRYPINDNLNLRFEPIFRYSLTPVSDAPILQYNYSLGGQFSIAKSL